MDFLLPSCPGLKLTHVEVHDQHLVLQVSSTTTLACCPVCQTASRQVHCYYTRSITDLCGTDRRMRLALRVRRFVCSNVMCSRRTFAERPGEQIKASARRTKRCDMQLKSIGLMRGGQCRCTSVKRHGIAREFRYAPAARSSP
jgi:transposase